MDLYDVLDQIVALLQQRGRVTYNALKLQFTWTTTSWRSSRTNSSTPTHRWSRTRGVACAGRAIQQ